MAKFRSVARGVYAGRCSSPWRAARSRAGVPSDGGNATGLEPGLARVKTADVGSFPHLRTHTHRSTEVQRAAGGGARLASTRVACDIVPACARKGATLRLGAGVHLARPQWRTKAGMQSHVTRHTTHDTTSRHHAACINGGLPERSWPWRWGAHKHNVPHSHTCYTRSPQHDGWATGTRGAMGRAAHGAAA
jgi:hypothetical protein